MTDREKIERLEAKVDALTQAVNALIHYIHGDVLIAEVSDTVQYETHLGH